ncbi:MAG: PilZ domain-containing protein [Lachnospiraceae bacterium]|nr:PilZ domain-containing protein [Lachnospiraceae bacterium]
MIEIFDIVRPGDRVDIESVKADELPEDERKYFITKVFDVSEDGQVEIIMPTEKTKLIVLSVGMVYELFFYAGKGIYACTAEVVSRRNDTGVAIAVLSLTSELRRHQRREYYRYSCVIGMTSAELTKEEATLYEQGGTVYFMEEPAEKGVIVDLSGGGIRFVTGAGYREGSLVRCRFMLELKGQMRKYDLVVRILSVESVVNNPSNSELRGQFLRIENGEREEIIRFIFDEERKGRARQSGNV